ncbi:hypothetical protein COX86_03190 [Candidatus Micrarchaeota archaeon CG_4_10_14_0_2_um_filter_60_11]|nr:MAG: hypothetical protein AUJ16_01255 [Candidatus Micrarchaeota archaeon CG1_02_60_51]PIN96366.1 MAG: hypothetical protein COU39_01720 [Candidatus Micrarchaeota archaeon CG10_big_fil_rev_8_21_14_0_10_60_32]PIO02033.1 MAG: hypothetical protein COT58_02000 [Candidatus Micrarchaeota archaeon CG09_land_8_20_14_0_10_60_16]PIY91835.1 MAG: hypothetical protein COY71_00985 [Candidatus Micrarchaeota archaeon CG_4_10_14_0_8_um_filter_60_7]PIZ90783.1 MAG: hypothetical protein COX86_03190 [Candidatus Mi
MIAVRELAEELVKMDLKIKLNSKPVGGDYEMAPGVMKPQRAVREISFEPRGDLRPSTMNELKALLAKHNFRLESNYLGDKMWLKAEYAGTPSDYEKKIDALHDALKAEMTLPKRIARWWHRV